MSENIRSTNLRFNLEKDTQKRAWQYLQNMDKQQFKSYSNVIAVALVDYFDRYYRSQDDPYFETREREERFVNQIISSVESAMEKTLPVFLAGCMVGMSQVPVGAVSVTQQELDEEVDWDFLGELVCSKLISQKGGEHMTQFLTQSSPIPPYMAFPRFLLDKDGLNETAKILYTILLDRARLSQKNDGWTDEQGHVFIFFPIKSLAETMHKSEMSVKTALNALEKENLIARKRQGAGFPNRIYVKYPPEALNQTDRIFSVKQTENCPTDGQKTVSVTDRKLSSSNKEKNNIKRTNSESKDDRTAYGSYQNVFLSTEELKALKDEVPHYQEYIEKLSSYMASSGKQYSSHAATIRSWALRDHPAPVKRTYECKEDESL